MNRLLASLFAMMLLGSPASAQDTKASLTTTTASNFPDNTTGLITPSILRTTMADYIASWQQAPRVNAQVGTTYTFAIGDYGFLVTFNNASPVAVTLPQATGSFTTWNVITCNQGAGAVTITPTVSTIGGASTLVLQQNQCRTIISDATNYQITTGAIQPQTCSGSQWVNAITANYQITCSQPAFTDISGILALNKGGTAANLTASNGGIVYSGASAFAVLAGTATANLPLLSGSSTTPAWGAITYPASATSGGVAYFSSTSAMASSGALTLNGPVLGGGAGGAPVSMVAGTNGQVIIGQSGTAPLWKTISGDLALSAAGVATIASVNGVAFPASPSTNTVPVVTSSNQITYQAVPNAALANSAITLNAGSNVGLTAPGSMSLGSSYTIGSTSDTPRFAGLGLGGASNTRGLRIYGSVSGFLDQDVATAAGSNKITWPAGTIDFSATGGASQVVKQASVGSAFTVSQENFTDLAGSLAAAQVATATITGQTVNNSPNASNDYQMYFSAADNAVRRCTIGACAAAATAGVSSLNGLTGGLSVAQGAGIGISAAGSSVTVSVLAGQIPGTVTNDSASSGNVGQYISSSIASGSAVSLTNNTAADVTSISLTAGDWQVCGNVIFTGGGSTTVTLQIAWTSATSATLPTSPNGGSYGINAVPTGTSWAGGSQPTVSLSCARYSLSTTTTIYLGAFVSFATSTESAYGFIGARRAR